MSVIERERVWWVGLATGTVGTWTTDEASVEAARAAGWRVEEFVPAADHRGAVARLEALERELEPIRALVGEPGAGMGTLDLAVEAVRRARGQ